MNSYPGPYGQVLTNLFLNSVTHAFSDGKGGTISIKVRASGDDYVEILFSDDGRGMSLDVRRKAFDPFFTTGRNQGSTGLGLHIVHSIVTNCLAKEPVSSSSYRERHRQRSQHNSAVADFFATSALTGKSDLKRRPTGVV